MRTRFAETLKVALKAQDKPRTMTLRLIQSAVNDRDIANRGVGKGPATNDEIVQILAKMVKQREESARAFDQGNRAELAAQERAEIEIIREFLPQQMSDDDMQRACRDVIAELGATGPKDMGRCMAVLKERFPGKMDFGKASGVLKELLK